MTAPLDSSRLLRRMAWVGLAGLPLAAAAEPTVPPPVDHAFQGHIALDVDATDTARKIFRIHEAIPVQASGAVTLLYPEWETSSHGRTVSAANLAGLTILADGKDIAWTRDPVDMHAFHIDVPAGTRALAVDFQYITRVDDNLLRDDLVNVAWQHMLVYPAGWFARNIPVQASLKVADGLTIASSLAVSPAGSTGGITHFAEVPLDTLLDAPAFAARYMKRLTLSEAGRTPMQLDLIALDPADIAASPTQVDQLGRLVRETRTVMGDAPYAHFDGLVILSDDYSAGGIEHASSAEIYLPAAYLRDPAHQLGNMDLIAHEHVHAWNGRWRQPADLWTPTPNVPSRNSLLWVYEGQTEFWGRILGARSGMRTPQQTLDKLALDAAAVDIRRGRAWKSLEDTSNDPIYVSGRNTVWPDWQRRKDYYGEGVMLWLDVEAQLRKASHGKVGMDDFAHAFFAVHGGTTYGVATYTFDDVCAALARLAPMDWKAFLNARLTAKDAGVLSGLEDLGWKLTYTDTPTVTFQQDEDEGGATNLSYSLGLSVDAKGRVRDVVWGGPAFNAGMAPGDTVTKVNGQAFSTKGLLDAVAHSTQVPVTFSFTLDGKSHDASIDYHAGARYPHLERTTGKPDRLSPLLHPKT